MTTIPLGPGPEIIPITLFFQNGLQAIVSATTKETFDTAFDTLFAKNATFTLNGSSVKRATYEAALRKQSAAQPKTASASLTILQSVENDDIELKIGNIPSPGVAGVTYQVTIFPETTPPQLPLGVSTSSSANFVVENNNSLGDNRQIIEINQVNN